VASLFVGDGVAEMVEDGVGATCLSPVCTIPGEIVALVPRPDRCFLNVVFVAELEFPSSLSCRNIVATVNLECRLDLKTIALHARNAEYNPKVCCLSAVEVNWTLTFTSVTIHLRLIAVPHIYSYLFHPLTFPFLFISSTRVHSFSVPLHSVSQPWSCESATPKPQH